MYLDNVSPSFQSHHALGSVLDVLVDGAAAVGNTSSTSKGTVTDAALVAAALSTGSVTHTHPTVTLAAPTPPLPSIRYVSTRGGTAVGSPASVSFSEAVLAGVAPDGGLFVPATLPTLDAGLVDEWASSGATYADVATRVFAAFVGPDEIPAADLRALIERSYASGGPDAAWDTPEIAPLVELAVPRDTGAALSSGRASLLLLEQFHGPTAAFKDHALQLLGNLFEYLLQQRPMPTAVASDGRRTWPRRITILGATSGDTGSAAIAGLRGKAGVDVVIMHPEGRVAPVQAMQMTSVLDANVHNIALRPPATFDDAQALVKAAFADAAFNERHALSAINSINWARLLAQVVYYGWAAVQVRRRQIGGGPASPLTFVVPTGNFGNALSGYYARAIGLVPSTTRFVVATNANDVLHRFFTKGDYTAPAGGALQTLAPSMDIQRASNLERYLYAASGGDAVSVRRWMQDEVGGVAARFTSWPESLASKAADDFASAAAGDADIDATIRRYLDRPTPYALCPHTAAGVFAAEVLLGTTTDRTIVVLATAHPAKFASGTPSLRGLYPGVETQPEEAAGTSASSRVDAVMPALPRQLVGLGARPRRVVSVRATLEDVEAYVDAAVVARVTVE